MVLKFIDLMWKWPFAGFLDSFILFNIMNAHWLDYKAC